MSSSLVHLGLAAASGLVLGAAGALTLSPKPAKASQLPPPPPQQQPQQPQAQPPAAFPLSASRQGGGGVAQAYAGSLAQSSGGVVVPSSIGSSLSLPSPSHKLPSDPLFSPGPISDVLTRLAYTTAYDRRLRIPSWTAEHLTAASLKSGGGDRGNARFEEDEGVPEMWRARLKDYYRVRVSSFSSGASRVERWY
jgi:endonuclease G